MGVVLAVPAILAGISAKKNEDQKDEERAEAQRIIDQLMDQESADETQGQADDRFLDNSQQRCSKSLLTQSKDATFKQSYATAELTFLSAYLRGHTMEAIGKAKLREGSTSMTSDNDKFLATLHLISRSLSRTLCFVGSINDGLLVYIENIPSMLSQINSNINQAKRTQVIAQAKLDAYIPLIQEVDVL
ncbi:hypothetical protein EG329_007324 [Mollisiaceae sp. DMI_Dod_QoI]|nr:hypothetical protein EG329_007324 [Helotiales sp. DMI_Dod_QoI]